jgi:nucleoside-diphosphate-sugar epimerase
VKETDSRFSKVLVAGGAGFIGSHIVDRLVEKEIEVTVLDNLYSGQLENVKYHKGNKKFQFMRGDIRNFGLVKRVVKDTDAVFNDAAVVSVPRSMEDPVLANEVNVRGTLNLLEACLNSGVKRFVQASSASVYGNTATLPLKEDFATKPISPYAVSELAAENYARVFCSAYGLETVCLRYFNVYGPRQTFNIYSGVITMFVNQLLQNQQPVIFGNGKQTRDFIYVQDVVEANMLALATKEARGEVFNIATGAPSTVNQLVLYLQEITGKKNLKPVHKAPRPGDIRESYAGIEKAKRILGYEPKFSLKKGLTELVKWHTKKKR